MTAIAMVAGALYVFVTGWIFARALEDRAARSKERKRAEEVRKLEESLRRQMFGGGR